MPTRGALFTERLNAIERRPFLKLTASALAAAGACKLRAGPASRRSTLIIAWPYDADINAVDNEGLKYLVFLPLLTDWGYDQPVGRLADRWEHSADYRDWTFHLRSGIRWHDSMPVTAYDVKFTLELLAHPDVLEMNPEDIEAITVVDASTVKVRFRDWRAAGKISGGWEIVLPRHLLEQLPPRTYKEWDFWNHPVGNGPYRFARYVPQTMMQFDANRSYYHGTPSIEHVILKFTRQAGLVDLLSGNVDVLMDPDPVQLAMNPAVRGYYSWGGQLYGILWNSAHEALRDPRVRRALTLALDRRELARLLHLPDNIPIVDGPFTRGPDLERQLAATLPFDPEQSAALLNAAGWAVAAGNGARVRGREGLRLALLVSGERLLTPAAVYLQSALQRVGVTVDIQSVDRSVVPRRVGAGEFDGLLTFLQGSPSVWQRWFGAKSPLGFHSPALAELLERLPLASTPDEDGALRRRLTELLRVEVPATFLFPRVTTVFARPRVRGLSTPSRVDPLNFIDELSLDDRSLQ